MRDLARPSRSVTEPPHVVYELVAALGRVIMLKEKPELSGPVNIVKETARAAENGPADLLMLLGMLSAYLGGFNLLPVPRSMVVASSSSSSRRSLDARPTRRSKQASTPSVCS